MTTQTRREFLEGTLLTAAAAALAGSRTVHAAQGEKQSASPNERLRVGVVGAGDRATVHLGFISQRQDCEVVAICDVDEQRGGQKADAIEKSTGKRPAFVRDLRKLYDDKSIDAVSIVTPNHWHALAAIWAMQAGKDLYLEKPVSHNLSEGRRIVEAARKTGRICQTATQSRSSPGTREMMDFLRAGGIGEIALARGLCYRLKRSIGPKGTYAVPASVDYDLWCGPAAMKPPTRQRFHYDWHWQWEFGNGESGSQGPHQVDIARWGMGLDGFGKSVLSYGGRLGYEDAGETPNTQVTINDFGDRAITFEVRGLRTEPLEGATIGTFFYGTKGYALHGGRKATINEEDGYDGGVVFDKEGGVIRTFKGIGFPACDAAHFGNFVQAVRSRKVADLHADIEQGHLSAGLSHLGNVSYRLGEMLPAVEVKKRLEHIRTKDEVLETFERVTRHLAANNLDPGSTKLRCGAALSIDAVTETFTGPGSDKANPLLTREYRKGFVV